MRKIVFFSILIFIFLISCENKNKEKKFFNELDSNKINKIILEFDRVLDTNIFPFDFVSITHRYDGIYTNFSLRKDIKINDSLYIDHLSLIYNINKKKLFLDDTAKFFFVLKDSNTIKALAKKYLKINLLYYKYRLTKIIIFENTIYIISPKFNINYNCKNDTLQYPYKGSELKYKKSKLKCWYYWIKN